MKTVVIVNPASGGGDTAGRWPEIARQITATIGDFDTIMTTAPGDATVQARKALKTGAERIIAVGGDGTMNEVCNGFLENDRPVNPDAVLGIIHAGTGGDFRWNLGIGDTLGDQLAAIGSGNTRLVSLGKAEFTGPDGELACRYFTVICAFGFSSEVNKSVNAHPRLKKWMGPAVFFSAVIGNILKSQRHQVKITSGDTQIEGPILVGAAANGARTGGSMLLAPDAEPVSKTLDFVLAEAMPRTSVLAILPHLAKGTHLGRPGVRHWRGTEMTVEPVGDKPVSLDMDGDIIGTLPLRATILPHVVKVAHLLK